MLLITNTIHEKLLTPAKTNVHTNSDSAITIYLLPFTIFKDEQEIPHKPHKILI